MLTTIKGYYEHGAIILKEEPPVNEKTEVMITFLTDKKGDVSKKRMPGGIKGKVALPSNFNEPLEDRKDYM